MTSGKVNAELGHADTHRPPSRLNGAMSLPRPVKAVVFDMDGLLVDTETVVFSAMQRAAGAIGHEMPFPTFQRMVGLTHDSSDRILLDLDNRGVRHRCRGDNRCRRGR